MFFYTFLGLIVVAVIVAEVYSRHKEQRRRNALPNVTSEEFQEFIAKVESAALPMVKLILTDHAPSPSDTHVGGGIWVPNDTTDWPRAKDGFAYLHLAQLNFSELSGLEGFPSFGILQIFARTNNTGYVGTSEDPEGLLTRWYPDPVAGHSLPVPPELSDAKNLMFTTEAARKAGLGVKLEPAVLPANPYTWPFSEEDFEQELTRRSPEDATAKQLQDSWEDRWETWLQAYGTHWAGGHPNFAQEDPREYEPSLRHLNRVLLHLGADNHINLGDGGEVNIMISENDLAHMRFDRAYMEWAGA